MNVYRLVAKDVFYGYDHKIVVAKSKSRAREIANSDVGDEGRIWHDKNIVSCELVDLNNEGELLSSFRAAKEWVK